MTNDQFEIAGQIAIGAVMLLAWTIAWSGARIAKAAKAPLFLDVIFAALLWGGVSWLLWGAISLVRLP
jgi:hypothetical protein